MHRAGLVCSLSSWYNMVNLNKGGRTMSETYCGKSCQTCGYRAETSCRGCLEEASRECKLALCCRQKGHKTCESCTYNSQCGMYRGRDTAPQFRLAQRKAVLEYQQSLREKGAVMAKWLWVLFWLFVPSTIASVLGDWVPSLRTVTTVVSMACLLIYGAVLLKLASQEQNYRTAGILTLVSAAGCVLALLIENQIAASFLVIILCVLDLLSSYYEFTAHADVLEGVDNLLSEQWRKLWKWMIGATIAMVLGVIFLIIVIGALVVLAATIALLVIGILKLVYLYRTAQTFQFLSAS